MISLFKRFTTFSNNNRHLDILICIIFHPLDYISYGSDQERFKITLNLKCSYK